MAAVKKKALQKEITFQQSGLAAIVWDKDTDSALAEFKKGLFKTRDPRVAKRLESLGYKSADIGPSPERDPIRRDRGPSPKPQRAASSLPGDVEEEAEEEEEDG